ncbi:MAG: hypothetical protein K6F88_03325 [Ruminococcus sp.]|nr:hypothetical protein [Ruminococcus sp.]
MTIKKTMSVVLSVMIMLTAVCGCFAVTANAAGTVTYSYVITTNDAVNAFEGRIHYPSSSLSVNSITFNGTSNNKNGKILFNYSNVNSTFDFSDGKTLITVVFDVNGAYSESDIYGELTDFYNIAHVASGNSAFDYANILDGEVTSCGHTDIDTPANSYANTKYAVTYSYKEYPASATNSTYTKSVWSNLSDAKTIAELYMPRIDNPYYTHSVASATLSGTDISATMSNTEKTYEVTLDNHSQGEFRYLTETEVAVDGTVDFLVNGVRVARGSSFKFFVTGDTDITTEAVEGTICERASLINNALYISNNGNNAVVKMEMLASAVSTCFVRMGVAYSGSACDADDIKSAVTAVTTGTGRNNKIAVHNSTVDKPNMSGQYQFIYAPYISVSKVSKDQSLYFYSYVVNNDGTITVSAASQVNFSNVLA